MKKERGANVQICQLLLFEYNDKLNSFRIIMAESNSRDQSEENDSNASGSSRVRIDEDGSEEVGISRLFQVH